MHAYNIILGVGKIIGGELSGVGESIDILFEIIAKTETI